jgi:hypothetical protein
VGRADGVALACLLAGVAALLGALVLAGADEQVTRYRVRPLTRLDLRTLAAVAAGPAGLALCSAAGDRSLRWEVGLDPALPAFHLLPALCVLLLAAPALIPATREATAPDLVGSAA